MGYLCPVCEEPFGDAQACANHLAVTAILHGDCHEEWLAEKVGDCSETRGADGWESIPRSMLAELVVDRADETEHHDHPGDHGRPVESTAVDPASQPAITDSAAAVDGLDADAQAILREARELTEQMQQRGPSDEGKQS